MRKLMTAINLHLFEMGGGVPAGGDGSAAVTEAPAAVQRPGKGNKNPLASVQYGKQPEETVTEEVIEKPAPVETKAPDPAERKAAFEKYISENKDLYGAKVQQAINERFKNQKAQEEKMNSMNQLLQKVSDRYGVDPSDLQALAKAMESDSDFLAPALDKEGVSADTYQKLREGQRAMQKVAQIEQAQQQQEQENQFWSGVHQQGETIKAQYPGFDLRAEIENETTGKDFLRMIRSGVPVKTAYEAAHLESIMTGAIAYTAQQIEQKVVNNVLARGMRPSENGTGGSVGAVVKQDVSKLTKADRQEINRRARSGERIVF